MLSPDAITVCQLARFVGLPGTVRRDWRAADHAGRPVVAVCRRGLKLSQGVAAWLRHTEALDRLALIVRGADTARPDLAPEAPGLLAASLGLSRMFKDDLAQLDAGLALYDAFYRWARDAVAEAHNWPAPIPAAEGRRVREPAP